MANITIDIPEDAIKLRSYQIWQREGCPQGEAIEHWLRAKAELEAELSATTRVDGERHVVQPYRKSLAFVVARIPISSPPSRSAAIKIAPERRAPEISAAKR